MGNATDYKNRQVHINPNTKQKEIGAISPPCASAFVDSGISHLSSHYSVQPLGFRYKGRRKDPHWGHISDVPVSKLFPISSKTSLLAVPCLHVDICKLPSPWPAGLPLDPARMGPPGA